MSLVWIALVAGLLAVVASAVLLVVRALELWRIGKAFFGDFGERVDALSRSVDALAAREGQDLERLEPALARLRRSSAQLAVLRNAIARVREQASSALALYPRK
jgi:two-component sensor histidine kinase